MSYLDADARKTIVSMVACPGCGMGAGNPCVTATGKKSPPHILRVNAARRRAVQIATPTPCPAGCGGQLGTHRAAIIHIETGDFACQ